jgi:hypothetical protein
LQAALSVLSYAFKHPLGRCRVSLLGGKIPVLLLGLLVKHDDLVHVEHGEGTRDLNENYLKPLFDAKIAHS